MVKGMETRNVRRVVTGHDCDGRSMIVSDEAPPVVHLGDGETSRLVREVWATIAQDGVLARGEATAPAPSATLGPHATEIRIVDMPAGGRREMHRTDTIDYGIVLCGEVYLIVEHGETLLRSGDIVIQRGTSHAWHNRSAHAARLVFINISGHITDLQRCPQV